MGPHAQDEPTRDNVVAVVSVRSNALQLTKSKITYINKVLNAFIQEEKRLAFMNRRAHEIVRSPHKTHSEYS